MFAAFVFGSLLVIFLIFVAMGRWHKRSAAAIWDKDRVDRWETQAKIEERDIPEMIAAQNARRAARGERPLTKEEIDARVAQAQRKQLDAADRDVGRRQPEGR
ncbi:MAG: hypothetical protein QOJ38_2042 [Solirubrobacterales bacterium]|jgi:hypothetical protein|nr:hypothetical protein [Solirubrobacterales bacterium]